MVTVDCNIKSLAGRRLFSKIGIQWECKSKGQCKDMLQIALGTHIPYKKHLKPMNIPSHFGRMTWNNLTKALQGHSREDPNQQEDPTMVPNGMKWHQQTYQRLPGKEQGYSPIRQECQSKQMNILEWLAEGRNVGINPAKTTRMAVWSLELGGVKRMKDTLEVLKCQKPLIQGFRHDAKCHTEITRKGKSCKQTQECVSTANGLINIVIEELVLACLNLGKPFGLEEDTLAYSLGMTLFQGKKNR
jgi:hypothetical protein